MINKISTLLGEKLVLYFVILIGCSLVGILSREFKEDQKLYENLTKNKEDYSKLEKTLND